MTLTQRLMALFAGNDTHHGTHGEPELDPNGGLKWTIRKHAKTIKLGPSEKHWNDHLAGTRPLGVVPITTENTASWGSIDYDVYDEDLTALIERVEKAKLPLVPCRSKSGGLHLWLFTQVPVEAALLQTALREMAASIGIGGSEIFPKQSKLLTDRGDQGSWMVMPYYGGTFDGKLQTQVGLKKTGAEMALSEFVKLCESKRQTEDELRALGAATTRPKAAKGKTSEKKEKREKGKPRETAVPFSDGPPCLVHIINEFDGVPQGVQNTTLFHMGVYYQKKYPDEWRDRMHSANEAFFTPPLSRETVDGVIRSMEKKDYNYRCKEEPMVSHCDSILCRMKRYGVGAGGVAPIITSLKKLNSEPPVWFVEVEGARFECSTEDLQVYARFHKLCMEHLTRAYMPLTPSVWFSILAEALENIEEIEDASPDAGVGGEFLELLELYLTSRQRGQKEEDLLSGRPWENEEEGRHYFQLSRLKKFLEREGFKEMKRGSVSKRILDMGGSFLGRNIKGKFINLHWIPSAKLHAVPEIDPPPLKQSPI